MPLTLPSKYCCSPAIFDQETQQIFRRSWLAVARCTELPRPGGYRTTTIEGCDLILVRAADRVRCFYNTCRHRGARLLSEPHGALENRCVICPYHAWKYDLNGALVAAPNMHDVHDFDPDQHGLHEVPCVPWLGFLMVCLDADATSLDAAYQRVSDQFAPWQMESLVTAASIEYEVAANWKLVMQNYSECYHCPTVHPSLHRLTNYRSSTNDLESGPFLGGPMQLNAGFETMSIDGARVGCPIPKLNDAQQHQVYYYVLFPNLLVSLHPDYVMAHRLSRIAPNRTRITCEFYFLPEALADPAFTPDRATEFWDEVNRQDWHVCELSQRGITNPAYQPGPYSPYERMLVAFDEYYLKSLRD